MARATQTATLVTMKSVWRDENTGLWTTLKLLKILVASIFLYVNDSWTLDHSLKLYQSVDALEDSLTSLTNSGKILTRQLIWLNWELVERKTRWYGHVTWSDGLCKESLSGNSAEWKVDKETVSTLIDMKAVGQKKKTKNESLSLRDNIWLALQRPASKGIGTGSERRGQRWTLSEQGPYPITTSSATVDVRLRDLIVTVQNWRRK